MMNGKILMLQLHFDFGMESFPRKSSVSDPGTRPRCSIALALYSIARPLPDSVRTREVFGDVSSRALDDFESQRASKVCLGGV